MSRSDDKQPLEIRPSAFEPLDPGAAPSPPPRANPLRWLLLASAAVFLLVMGFLLTARSLEVVVVAETPVEVDVEGLALPFGNRYLLRPGTYRVSASAEGYHPLTEEVTVDDRDSQRLERVLRPLPGLLSVDSKPIGARVLIDGEPVGTTPLADLPVEAGEHRLTLRLERYLPGEQALEITGRRLPQNVVLALEPAWAEVSVDSQPPGAQILVDGEAAGTTPATVEILQGERQIMLQLPGFAPWEQGLELTAGQPVALGTVELQPAAGVLELASRPSGANVTLDGEFQGQTPISLEVSPGRAHRLAVFKPGYRRYNGTVELPAAGRASRTVTLQAQLGKVRFEISPANAVLRIDGKPRGRGSQTLSLPAFEHSVEVALAGHATVRKRVTPRPGLEQLVQVSLQTEEAARMARLQPEITTSLGQTLLLFKPGDSAQPDFTMGASRREPGRRSNEVLHPVSLRRMFYLSTTEVTNAQFRLYQADHNSGQIDGNSLNREHQPAVQVSWQQAASFCNWLSRREGLPPFYRETNGIIDGYNASATGYRLPTEAEWAWAARADGPNWLKFPWGDSFPPTVAVENYADNTSAYVTGRILNGYTDGHVVSATVASFRPNSKGLYDLGGNVAEWVHDVYSIPSANGAARTDPLGSQSGDNYVIRGASWAHSKIAELRLSYRDYGQAGRDDVGFRLARYAE
jgi:formylglycine-generating enzyme required for sulfatase activity